MLDEKEVSELQMAIRGMILNGTEKLMWWEITDYLLANYSISKKLDNDDPKDHIPRMSYAEALEKMSDAFRGLADDLRKFCGMTGEEK